MAVPGFSAETTLYRSPASYRRAASRLGSELTMTSTVVPAARAIEWVKCALGGAGAIAACTGPQAGTGLCYLAAAVAAAECAEPVSDFLDEIF
jgi:hypothetical protein